MANFLKVIHTPIELAFSISQSQKLKSLLYAQQNYLMKKIPALLILVFVAIFPLLIQKQSFIFYSIILELILIEYQQYLKFMHLRLVFLVSILLYVGNSIVKIEYSAQNRFTSRFIHDIYDSFYVDIGGFDPIYFSQSAQLHTKGWNGLIVDASYQRLRRFFVQRPRAISMNQAIDKDMFYAQLVRLSIEFQQGINPDYTKFLQKTYPQYAPKQTGEINNIATISMKQICQRFYPQKPVFMNLDIQGNEGRALQSNDWNNTKCRPQILFVQALGMADENNPQIRNGQIAVEVVMSKHGYKKHPYLGNDQIWIQEDKFQKYSKKYDEYQKIQNESHRFVSIHQLDYQMMNKTVVNFNIPAMSKYHFDADLSFNYLYFAKNNENLLVSQLNYLNNQGVDKSKSQYRPIFVLEFNPKKSQIIIDDWLDQLQDVYWNVDKYPDSKQQVHFWKLKLRTLVGYYTVFIMDHQCLAAGQSLKLSFTYDKSVQELQENIKSLAQKMKHSVKQKLQEKKEIIMQPTGQLQQGFKQTVKTYSSQIDSAQFIIIISFTILSVLLVILSYIATQKIKKNINQSHYNANNVESQEQDFAAS